MLRIFERAAGGEFSNSSQSVEFIADLFFDVVGGIPKELISEYFLL